MAYINRDTLLEIIADKNRNTCNGSMTCLQIKRIVENLPTADVVPKREVDSLIENAKTEVAREIFEEIEDDVLDFPLYDCDIQIILDKGRYAKLKKKYTEEKK